MLFFSLYSMVFQILGLSIKFCPSMVIDADGNTNMASMTKVGEFEKIHLVGTNQKAAFNTGIG